MNYKELKNAVIPLNGCFFAFSNEQFAKGISKLGISPDDAKEMIYRGNYGLYGTREALTEYKAAIKENNALIAAECDPQDVYDYEFINHECKCTGDDLEAIRIVYAYFGPERTMNVERIPGCDIVDINDKLYEL